MSKILSIVIPVFNKFNFTKSCLNDLSYLTNDHEIIIIDNGSTDETFNNLRGNKDIIYIPLNHNKGFAQASNIGYGIATSPNVLFLNNDIRVNNDKSNWTKPLIDKCNDGLVGPTMGQLDSNLNFVKESNEVLPGKSYLSGWCLASSKENFNKLEIKRNVSDPNTRPQIFSEEYGKAYFEDTDLSFRARKLKIAMNVVSIPVVHFGKQTSSQLNTYELYSNARKIFIKKWA